jgi:hypothetical protein
MPYGTGSTCYPNGRHCGLSVRPPFPATVQGRVKALAEIRRKIATDKDHNRRFPAPELVDVKEAIRAYVRRRACRPMVKIAGATATVSFTAHAGSVLTEPDAFAVSCWLMSEEIVSALVSAAPVKDAPVCRPGEDGGGTRQRLASVGCRR